MSPSISLYSEEDRDGEEGNLELPTGPSCAMVFPVFVIDFAAAAKLRLKQISDESLLRMWVFMIDCTHNAVRVYANSKFLRCNLLAFGMFRREKMVIRKVSIILIHKHLFSISTVLRLVTRAATAKLMV